MAALNGDQMVFLANESAERALEQMRPALPSELSESQVDMLRTALALTWLEGFGRGGRESTTIAVRAFDQAIAKLVVDTVMADTPKAPT